MMLLRSRIRRSSRPPPTSPAFGRLDALGGALGGGRLDEDAEGRRARARHAGEQAVRVAAPAPWPRPLPLRDTSARRVDRGRCASAAARRRGRAAMRNFGGSGREAGARRLPSRRRPPPSACATPGWTSTTGSGGMPPTGVIVSPMPRAISGCDTRHIGTSAPSASADLGKLLGLQSEPPEAVEQAQRRGGVGRAAAEPGGDRESAWSRSRCTGLMRRRWTRAPRSPPPRAAPDWRRARWSPRAASACGPVEFECRVGGVLRRGRAVTASAMSANTTRLSRS